MSDVSLSKAVRSNLLSLQNTASMMAKTQERLATGNKVNSALDNPTNFFTASALNSRASDMSQLLDSMANGIQTLEAADNGLEAITKNLESMQSTLRQARQDKSFQTASYTMPATPGFTATSAISFEGGAVGTTPVGIELTKGTSGTSSFAYVGSAVAYGAVDTSTFDISVDGATPVGVTVNQATVQSVGNGDSTIDSIDELTSVLSTAIAAAGVTGVAVSNDGTNVTLTSATTGTSSNVAISSFAGDGDSGAATNTLSGVADDAGTAGAADGGAAKTADELVNEINNNSLLEGKVRASNDNGKLRIENLSTQELTVDGVSATGTIDGTSDDAAKIGGNEVRAGLADQYNELRDQLDKLADDASFNGVNLLRGDNLKITFNETGTSALDIQTEGGESINSESLGLKLDTTGRLFMQASDLDSDAKIDEFLGTVKAAIGEVRSQASSFGSSLSIVENRQDFTKNMINTLETGAGNLTLADTNEEAANLLALQTRQQLASTALSMASQADQAVLRLF